MIKLLGIVALTVIASCTGVEDDAAQGEGWHFSGFEEVRAYRLNWDDEHSFEKILNAEGELNPTRIPKEGIILNDSQVRRLHAAVTGRHPGHAAAGCFYPHHAFVFVDAESAIVGHIDVCFLCSRYRGKPDGFAESWDLDALRELVEDLGLPVRNEKWNQPDAGR